MRHTLLRPVAPLPEAGSLSLRAGVDGALTAEYQGTIKAVTVRQAFPWTEPAQYLSLRDEKDEEFALVEDVRELASASRAALESAMDEVLETQYAKLAITRKLTATMREVWGMQPRFEMRSGQRAYRLLEAARFRMAYDFLALRAASGEVPAELEAWWRAFQGAGPETRAEMLLPDTGPRKRRRRRRKKRPAAVAPEAA